MKDNTFHHGQWVLINGKSGQYIHPSREGMHTVDIGGIWEDYPTDSIVIDTKFGTHAEAFEKASDLQKVAECYQPLFDLMENEHGKTLLVSELDEIISAANKVQENVKGLFAQTTLPKLVN